MIPFSVYIKEYSWLFSLYFSSLNLKYLKLTKMELSRFAMKLFIYLGPIALQLDLGLFGI